MNTTPLATAQPIDLPAARAQIDTVLTDFLNAKTDAAAASGLPRDLAQAVRRHLQAGGKRLRPLLCVTGWHAADGHGDTIPLLRTAAAVEMFHAFCLIHDDIMDNSEMRHGRPTVHRHLAADYGVGHSPEQARKLGADAALLVGDMALAWSDELLHTAGHPSTTLAALHDVIDLMREEVIYGQYLDLTSTGQATGDIEQALQIILYKTAKYTVERPLHIGATLAGADQHLLDALSAFALPLGEAFQLRDDLIGAFGNEATSGKSCLDDLREGKPTVLIAHALKAADDTQARLLRTLYGNPRLEEDSAATLRTVLKATRADQTVEHMIADRFEHAVTALYEAPIPPHVQGQLRHLAENATWRTS
ncbi:polyprenyl synthetase family protein [Streptomyces noursei]|uniref:polyprenyl synthetase family protein n=1 Tax=Streptomyces noursei TaxID=1971 RepID=UPI00167590F4|nr:polyprenyl synthetase family protein [Streptomyces noursei]MCZ1014129.1 polyprenyl synthetase family protein [Streptomyces noursei]GGX24247.1 polyprenyl synthetase [Streptomyces noursei]